MRQAAAVTKKEMREDEPSSPQTEFNFVKPMLNQGEGKIVAKRTCQGFPSLETPWYKCSNDLYSRATE